VADEEPYPKKHRRLRRRCEDLSATKPPRTTRGRRAHHESSRQESNKKAASVGEHVGCVNQQSERTGDDCADHLGDEDAERQPERNR